MSMNEKLREEREFDCETSIGSQKLATFPATVVFSLFHHQEKKRKRGKQEITSKAKIKNINDTL